MSDYCTMTLECNLNVTMLVAIICQLIVASIASPYHQYPFVFLLDVGNEELANTKTEQIRLSIPGGSLAVRYPAISDGDLITHVRVSSIDFGSDLKASILDGGPGYKYVVLVFLGNVGVTCDAVITLQTLPNQETSSGPSIGWSVSSMSQTSDDVSQSEIDNSIEDMSNDPVKNKNADLALQSSNDNYAKLSNDDDENDSSEIKDELDEDDKRQNIKEQDSYIVNESNEESDDKIEEQNSSSDSDDDDDDNGDDNDNYHADRFQGYQSKFKSNEFTSKKNDGLSDQDARMYIQDSIYDSQGHNTAEDSVELDQVFNDEEIHNDSDKYKDSNNNNFDSEYGSAVA